MKKEPSELTLLETFKSMAELMKNVEAIGFTNNEMQFSNAAAIPSISVELDKIQTEEFGNGNFAHICDNDDYTDLITNLEYELAEIGIDSVETTILTEVMLMGNEWTINPETNEQSNTYNFFKHNIDKLLEVAGDPLQAIEYIIGDLEDKYKHAIIEKGSDGKEKYKPVIKWDRVTIGFYCNQQRPDITLDHILYYLVVEKYGDKKIVERGLLSCALHELSCGVAYSLILCDLKKRRKEYDNTVSSELNDSQKTTNVNKQKVVFPSTANSSITYFELNASYSNLKKFKQGLEQRGYLNKDFPIEVFRRVFLCKDDSLKDKLIRQPVEPIIWKTNKSHLGYLIKQLSKNNVITEKEYYKIAENCFLFEGTPILNTVFHGMQVPAVNAKKKLDQICNLLI